MGVINCKKCGRMFNYIVGEKICPQCKEKEEELFQTVKKYVSDNKTASMQEICEACDVDQRQVTLWVREERLFFTDDSMVKINCERCGAVITTGRYCNNCKRETMNGLNNLTKRSSSGNDAPPTSGGGSRPNARMHIR